MNEYSIDQERLDNDFIYHAPCCQEQIDKFQAVRNVFRETAEFLMANVPPSRELAVALTQLELSNFAAITGIARKETAATYNPPPAVDVDLNTGIGG